MKIMLWILHLFKINIIQIIVNNARNPSISLQYIDSSIFNKASRCAPAEPVNGSGVYAENYYWNNNVTDIPDEFI
ncbi:hypothetical protein FOB58_005255 [Candida parapsilosis]|uniref:Uncharacterized protein n=2 Tax=Candida parapsilosis TaxID=5480 RepID=G8B5A3_CANPC|nr:uncharacterized protein CPAR2_602135 [Candida parapsilosis]KAF6043540.1 hypothetical protein FOB58_005255 [Candida parapsilosis]KAF6043962.1 hypothetical protein FOB59_004918 [Candida parapsilosis]KAF6045418.1 hypothetical protein FOB60_004990 [Candida parapsilosis]KAF6060204.1 hypothetical protein FOB61_005219 [Candida parapsilosis]CAD1813583.1 unnamed protein product [Candida parapsilosis]